MEIVVLKVKTRSSFGSRAVNRVRRHGQIPAVVYGHGIKPMAVEVGNGDLIRVLHTKAGENVIIDLNLDGAKLKERTCQIKEIQHNPVTDEINHVDFKIISLTEKIKVRVPVLILHTEECEGVKQQGGVLDLVHHEIEVECLPTEIPEKIEIDVRNLKIGDAIHLKELNFSGDVAAQLPADEVIVAVHAPRAEEEKVEAEAEVLQPEVIEKGKKEKPEEAAAAVGEAPKEKPKTESK